jgi:hypothetical protein
MSVSSGLLGRPARAIAAVALVTAVIVISTTRLLVARVRGRSGDPDAGLSMVEYVVMLVVAVVAVAGIGKIIYDYFTGQAKSATNGK